MSPGRNNIKLRSKYLSEEVRYPRKTAKNKVEGRKRPAHSLLLSGYAIEAGRRENLATRLPYEKKGSKGRED